MPPTPPRQSLLLLHTCLVLRQLVYSSESHAGAFCHNLSTGQPPQAWQRWLRHPGGIRTGALESRPQASIFEGAAVPPPPPAYLGVLGCPGAPGTSKWASKWAQRKAKGGGRVMQELRCLGAEPGSMKPPFPEEM